MTKGEVPGSIKLPGTDTSIKFGGYIKLDASTTSRAAVSAPAAPMPRSERSRWWLGAVEA